MQWHPAGGEGRGSFREGRPSRTPRQAAARSLTEHGGRFPVAVGCRIAVSRCARWGVIRDCVAHPGRQSPGTKEPQASRPGVSLVELRGIEPLTSSMPSNVGVSVRVRLES